MKCRGCGYALWKIGPRVCPECGLAFKLSERAFVPGKVVFCCPTCGTGYLGKSERGLPEPGEFPCAGCGSALRVDDLVLRRAAGTRGPVEARLVPWSERRRLGWWRAWWGTTAGCLSTPWIMLRGERGGGSALQAIWYGSLMWIVSDLLALLGWWVLMAAILGASVPSMAGVQSFAAVWTGLTLAVGSVCIVATLILAGALAHVALWLTGETRHGIGGTWDAVGYSSGFALFGATGAALLYFAPLTMALAVVIQCVVAGVMVSARQRVSWLRAALVSLVVFVTAVSSGAITMRLISWVAIGPGLAQVHNSYVPPAHLPSSLMHLRAVWRTLQFRGGTLGHGSELTTAGGVPVLTFVEAQVLARSGAAQIVSAAEETELRKRWAAQASTLPADAVAHRVGQFVFAHHEIDPNAHDPGLWLFLAAPVPVAEDLLGRHRSPGVGLFDGRIVVVRLDGQIDEIDRANVASSLAAQNALRARNGLSPLPDPFTILEGQPVVAGKPPIQAPAPAPPSAGGSSP